jgi:ABC-type dipeptide/oligopeptide/nickel transport system ATPase component
MAIMFDEKKMYIYGIIEEEGVTENFRSIVQPYIKGLAKSKPDLEVYSCLYVGCKKISLNEIEEEKEKDKEKDE